MTVNHNLTKRESEVLALVAQGYSNKEICEKLVISDGTITSHMCSIYHKFGLFAQSKGEYSTMRVKAALIYLRQNGLLRHTEY